MLNTIIFLSTFINLSLWFLFKENKEIRSWFAKGFLASGTIYFFLSLLMPDYTSWMNIGLHALFLFGSGFFLNTFSSNKIVFVSLMTLMSGGYFFVQTGVNPWPLNGESITEDASPKDRINKQAIPTDLDENNELLLELSETHQIAELQTIINQYLPGHIESNTGVIQNTLLKALQDDTEEASKRY